MIGHEVTAQFAAPDDAPEMTSWALAQNLFTPTNVDWRSYWWSGNSDSPPARRVSVIIRGNGTMCAFYPAGGVDVPPAWVPRPPDGWDDAVEASWQAFQASRAVTS